MNPETRKFHQVIKARLKRAARLKRPSKAMTKSYVKPQYDFPSSLVPPKETWWEKVKRVYTKLHE